MILLPVRQLQPLHLPPAATIDERFTEMHRRNPWIADYLEALAGELVANGATRIGVKQLWEVLRYTYTVGGGADGYRLNNVLTSRYARLLIERHPAWAGLIETRELRAA